LGGFKQKKNVIPHTMRDFKALFTSKNRNYIKSGMTRIEF